MKQVKANNLLKKIVDKLEKIENPDKLYEILSKHYNIANTTPISILNDIKRKFIERLYMSFDLETLSKYEYILNEE